jgi:uncharacterized MAPEG superfamily protein
MEKLNDLMQVFDVYNPALIALTILCVAVLMQSFLAGVFGFKGGIEVPGQPLKGSHKNFSFRALRTYGNSVENLPVFAITLILAIVADMSPAWVNWLAGIHVAIRLGYWGIYYSGVGKELAVPEHSHMHSGGLLILYSRSLYSPRSFEIHPL